MSSTDGAPSFQAVPAPTTAQLQILLARIIKRILKVLTRKGALVEEAALEIPYLSDAGGDPALAALQAAACTYRIALGPRAGQKVLTWKDPALALSSQKAHDLPKGCVSAQGFSLHAGVHSGPHQRWTLERLCRYITSRLSALRFPVVRSRLEVTELLWHLCWSGSGN